MSMEELEIARLSKLINSKVLNRYSKRALQLEAEAIRSLEEELEAEEELNNEHLKNYLTKEDEAKKLQQEKDEMERQNLEVLKLQIQEKKRRLKEETYHSQRLASHRDYGPKPSFLDKVDFKNQLEAQIQEKRLQKRKEKEREEADNKKVVDIARLSLEEEIKDRRIKQRVAQKELKRSWDCNIKAADIKRQIQRTRNMPMAHPLNFKRSSSVSSEHSVVSQARERLNQLQRQELNIKKEKEELLSIIHSKSSKRTTVSALVHSEKAKRRSYNYIFSQKPSSNRSAKTDIYEILRKYNIKN